MQTWPSQVPCTLCTTGLGTQGLILLDDSAIHPRNQDHGETHDEIQTEESRLMGFYTSQSSTQTDGPFAQQIEAYILKMAINAGVDIVPVSLVNIWRWCASAPPRRSPLSALPVA